MINELVTCVGFPHIYWPVKGVVSSRIVILARYIKNVYSQCMLGNNSFSSLRGTLRSRIPLYVISNLLTPVFSFLHANDGEDSLFGGTGTAVRWGVSSHTKPAAPSYATDDCMNYRR